MALALALGQELWRWHRGAGWSSSISTSDVELTLLRSISTMSSTKDCTEDSLKVRVSKKGGIDMHHHYHHHHHLVSVPLTAQPPPKGAVVPLVSLLQVRTCLSSAGGGGDGLCCPNVLLGPVPAVFLTPA